MGYSFYYPPENKVIVARNVEFLENSLINQEASESLEDLEIIQEEDMHPSIDTSSHHKEDDLEIDEPQSDIIPIRRSTRTRHAPDRMCLYIDAEEHELGDLDNEVWDLFDLPADGKTIRSKWLFKKKTDIDGAVDTYKARLVAKGYTQTPEIDYEETFSPAAHIRAIRILIAITAYYDYKIWQMDVKTAFLNGYLSKEVYMEQPEGFVNPKYPNRVCKLKHSIYGLKQASMQWNKRFDDEIKKFGFTQNRDEPCVYLKANGSNVTFLILYVDDILIMGNNIPMLQDVKFYLGRCFAMKDLGEAAYIFGIKIYRDRSRRTKQSIFATSSTEAEYIAGYDTSKESVWVRKFIYGLSVVPIIEEPINIYCDNTGVIAIANESGITKGARHFHAKVHYLRDVIEYGDVKLEKVYTDDNLADPFTKALAFPKHSEHSKNIRLLPASSLMLFNSNSYNSVIVIFDSTLRRIITVASKCYSPNGTTYNEYSISADFTGYWPYTFSEVNRFIVIGCNHFAWLTSTTKYRNVSTGCIVFCARREEVVGNVSNGRTEAIVPIVLEWAIGNLNSSVKKAMKEIHICLLAAKGYKLDINECNRMEDFPCYGTCINTPSNYTCKCKEGYSGDGKIQNDCRRKPFKVIVLSIGSGRGRGVKEKDLNRNKMNTSSGIGVSTYSDDIMNDDTLIGVASAVREGVTPYVVDMTGKMEKQKSLDDNTVLPLSTPVTTEAVMPLRVAYPVVANYVRNTWGKYELVRSMFSSSTGLFSFQFSSMDRLDAMLENAFSDDGLSAIATKLGTPLMIDSYTADMCMQSWGRSSYARIMIELRADVELKDNIVVVMPIIKGEGYYTCNIHVEYEWKPSRCTCCKVFGHVHEECLKNIGAGATKTLKKTSQTPKGIPIGRKMGFKPKQVSKSNPFEVLTSVDNDEDLGTNGWIANSADKRTNNVNSSNTSIGEKIKKIERQICEGKLRFVDDDGNPLGPTGIVESESKMEVVFDKTTNLRISKSGKDGCDKDYNTNSFLEQWRDSYLDNDDYDPYDDDMYENHYMFEHLQCIGLALLSILIGLSILCIMAKKRKLAKLKEKFFEQNGGTLLTEKLKSKGGTGLAYVNIFGVEELEEATVVLTKPCVIN
ncbi:retrotransposon protein, putative, ty1-copia subclass [Tanacetum coccineum]